MKTVDMFSLDRIKYSQEIKDPFPEHTFYEMVKQTETLFDKLFGTFKDAKPKYISIHEAYKKGYDQAYSEIKKGINLNE